MVVLELTLNGDGALADIPRERIVEMKDAVRVIALEGGMASGKPSVGIALPLPDGRVVFAQTSLALFLTAAAALKARFGAIEPCLTYLSP